MMCRHNPAQGSAAIAYSMQLHLFADSCSHTQFYPNNTDINVTKTMQITPITNPPAHLIAHVEPHQLLAAADPHVIVRLLARVREPAGRDQHVALAATRSCRVRILMGAIALISKGTCYQVICSSVCLTHVQKTSIE